MTTVFEHKNKLYGITERIDDKFLVLRASWMPDGKKLVEDMRSIKADNVEKVKRLIRLGRFNSFDTL